MRVCDICKGGQNNLYNIHTAIYVNGGNDEAYEYPAQVAPNEAELCKNCLEKLTRAMRTVNTIIQDHDNAQRYYTSLYDSPGGRGRC